jgi:hypothetical protein
MLLKIRNLKAGSNGMPQIGQVRNVQHLSCMAMEEWDDYKDQTFSKPNSIGEQLIGN